MTDAASDRARWTSAFADELAGFSPGPFVPEDEVDEVRWLSREDARSALSYDRDRGLLDLIDEQE